MDSAAPPGSPASPTRDKGDKEVGDEGSVVGKSGFQGEVTEKVKQVAPSWLSVAQDKKVLKKYDVEVSNKDGLHTVEIPDDVLNTTTPLWEDFVVGKFLDISPHVAKVHMVLNKIWKYGDTTTKVDVYEVNATTMRFRVSNPKAREKILKRGMWNIAGVPMIVTKWSPRSEEEKQEEEAIPMWVHLHRVPLHMYSWEGLSFITSAVGFPVKLHPETIACSNLEVAKVFAKVDVAKALPKEINFSKNGKEFGVEFLFPWLPSRCKMCDKWGHTEAVCVMKGKNAGKEVARKEYAHHQNSNQEVVDQSKVKNTEVVIEEEVLVVTETPKAAERIEEIKASNEDERMDAGEKEGVETNWSLVSPTKVGRSPGRSSHAKQAEDLHISASKFAVLSVEEEEEEGEFMERDSQTDVETQDTNDFNEEEGKGGSVEVQIVSNKIGQHDDEIKENETKGITKEQRAKKARSQDVNPMAMSTRSSSRHR